MPKLTFQLGAEVHRLVAKLFRAEVTRTEHRLPRLIEKSDLGRVDNDKGSEFFEQKLYDQQLVPQ